MAVDTGIKWTDSTSNPWWGCTKVEGAPACIDCYAEDVDKRGTPKDEQTHWGFGAPRRRISEKSRNEPLKWQRDADKFLQAHGRRQRVFTMSMGDLFDKEVDNSWRNEHFDMMERCDRSASPSCRK
jgi:protein gp37